MRVQAPAVAQKAKDLRLTVMQPAKIRSEDFFDTIASFEPEIGIVIAYGKILPARLLEIPKHGFLNVHASILPAYRGAAPIQRAIEAGEPTTGVSIMQVDEQLDHGAVFRIATLPIGPDERAPSVTRRLANLGADALVAVLDEIRRGTAASTEQDHGGATHAAKLEKNEGFVRFTDSVQSIYNRFRAFDPWPGVSFESVGEQVKILDMRPVEASAAPGMVLEMNRHTVTISVGDGAIELIELQRPAKARAAAADVARGLGWLAGAPVP